ncbi:uncharacterized protein LOC119099020 [Pollicipes pollicipes]|uniref:uncharacterized protein LOC119099020 n=1 Tax=Pollicipes pollicipes TaxID=41117 RepID=UPI0018854A2B|nr:uncharacterized protein LOC119099020 [Pollicipes pollicipes]
MVFPVGGQQLFVGEGDFSLTRSLFEHHSLPKDAIISCFSEDLTEEAAENAEYLSSAGISVITGVDATCLEKHPDISRHTFDYIIFNFPHTGHKMKIQLCRTLLRNFLCSASSLLTAQGQVWVTLCAGQGGTAGEVAPRAWSDSWQLTAQAAAAGLLLRRLEPFRPELYPGYRPTGNRGRQSRTFHTGRGVIHVLVRGAPLPLDRLADRLDAGGRALLLDGAPLPLAQYWLRRLPPADDSLAALIVSRLTSAAAAVRRRLLVRHEGRLFRAEDAVFESAGDDSVYHPPAYQLDMSFWLDGGAAADESFSWARLRRALRAVLGEVLVSLSRLDEYTQPDSGRRACTVRLQYQDLSSPLSYEAARRLHVQVLPDILSHALGVQPR